MGCLLQASLSCGQEVHRGGWLTLLHARIHAEALTFNVEARGPSVVQAAAATVIVKVRCGIYKLYIVPAVRTGLPPTASRFLFSLNRVCPILRRGSGGLGLSGRQLGPLFAPELHLQISQRLPYLPSLSFLSAHFVQLSFSASASNFIPRSQRFWFSANLSCLSCVRHFYYHRRGAAFPSPSSLSSVLLCRTLLSRSSAPPECAH